MKKKVLIIGKNAYLAKDFESNNFITDKIQRPLETDFEHYNDYDVVVNFCIQPEHFTRLLPEKEMIDVNIAKHLKKTKFVFLSSRKVYGSTHILKEYNETSKIKPFDFYSKNKVNIENKLLNLLGDNLLILRTGNIVGLPPKRNCPTFVGWLESELENNDKVLVTVNKESKKDFISKKYFQYVLEQVIIKDLDGTYNVGAGFALTLEDLMKTLVDETKLEFTQLEKYSEQFILNCDKLHKTGIKPFTKDCLLSECASIKSKILRE